MDRSTQPATEPLWLAEAERQRRAQAAALALLTRRPRGPPLRRGLVVIGTSPR